MENTIFSNGDAHLVYVNNPLTNLSDLYQSGLSNNPVTQLRLFSANIST